jgi:uridine kinase
MTAPPDDAGLSWRPFVHSRRMEDLRVLSSAPLFAGIASHKLEAALALLDVADAPAGTTLARAGDLSRGALFILEGAAYLEGPGGVRQSLPLGMPWTPAALDAPLQEPHTVVATSDVRVGCLTRARFQDIARSHAELGLELLRRAVALFVVRQDRPDLEASRGASPMSDGLPAEVDGALVVAARIDNRTFALSDWAGAGQTPVPLTMRDWEGREIYRRSVALLFLEAAAALDRRELRLGPSWTSGRLVQGTRPEEDRVALAHALTLKLGQLVKEGRQARDEEWRIDRAIAHFESCGWRDASVLLEGSAASHVRVVTYGTVWAPSPGPMLPTASMISNVCVLPHPTDLLLDYGERVRRELAKRAINTIALETESPRYGADMTAEERRWLEGLGIASVGDFNRACVTGEVRTLIDVAEGFHEKRIAAVADEIRTHDKVRIVAVAGPSSSGKTTFLRRLTTQLQVNGVRPLGISLDDYYVDRDKTVRGPDGDYDYEALEAIDRGLLTGHVRELLAGGAVKTARYDFVTGESHPDGGATLQLGPKGVLIVEGIHALNPEVFTESFAGGVYRIFVHPATALPFDPLSMLEPTDVRLLRRIVRDRHGRGAAAEQNLARWPSVRRGERLHIDPWRRYASCVFDTSLVYEVSVLKVFAERYLLEVPRSSPQFPSATRLRRLIAPFVPIYPDRVPPTSLLREFVGGAGPH